MTRVVPSLVSLALCTLFLGGCTRDPDVLKRRDLARGDEFAAQHKYAEAVIEYSRAIQRDPNFSEAYERMGQVHLAEGNQARAWQAYQRAANLAPDNLDLQVKAGGVLLLARRFDDARQMADRVLEKDPRNVHGLVLRANALVGLENLDTAITMVQDAVRMAPGESDLYSNLGSLQASAGDLAEAERMYRKALEVAPDSAMSYLPIGNFYWATGHPREAEQMFLKALELEPDNLLAHRAIGTFYLGSGQPLKAEASLRYSAEHAGDVEYKIALGDYYLVTGRPTEGLAVLTEAATVPGAAARAETRLAAYYLAAGQGAEAARRIEAVLGRFPKFAPAVLLKARLVLAKGEYDEALRLANQATVLQDDYIEALYLVGQLNAGNGDTFQAMEAYRKILEANPFAKAAEIEMSRMLLARGEVASSAEYLNRILQRTPEDQRTRLSLVRALIERKDLRGAELQLQEVNRQYPESAQAQSLTGTLFALKGDYRQARRWFDQAIQRDAGMLDATSGLIGLDLADGKPMDALRRAQLASEAAPLNVPRLLLLAKTYGAVKQLDKAEATLRKALEVDPNSFDAYGMLGQLLYTNGRLAEGRVEFEQLAARRPRSVAAHTMIGIIKKQEGNIPEAVEHYRTVLEIDPEAPVAANNLAWIYAEMGTNLDEAVILAKIARQKLPELAPVADTLGWAYYRNGKPSLLALAAPLLEEAVQKVPGDASFRYHLGATYARMGRTVDARRELQEALRLSPDFVGSAETRRILVGLQ